LPGPQQFRETTQGPRRGEHVDGWQRPLTQVPPLQQGMLELQVSSMR
jgi:hypothetical protein